MSTEARLVKLVQIPAARLQRRLYDCLNDADESASERQAIQHQQRAEVYWGELCRRGYHLWSTSADEAVD